MLFLRILEQLENVCINVCRRARQDPPRNPQPHLQKILFLFRERFLALARHWGNQMIRLIQQNIQFRPKSYPLFQFWPKIRLNNQFPHSRGQNKISKFWFSAKRKPKSKAHFRFRFRLLFRSFQYVVIFSFFVVH